MLDITFGYVLRSSMMTGNLKGGLDELPHRLDSVAQTPPTWSAQTSILNGHEQQQGALLSNL